MNMLLFVGLALLALAIIAWQAWRELWPKRQRLPPAWETLVKGLALEQARGRHREVRDGVLAACRKLDSGSERRHVRLKVRARLALLLARDAVYTDVVREIRTACAAEPAISERALCVQMRHYVLEDIRQCMQLAEYFGQIRRFEHAAEPLVTACFESAG